MYNAEVISADYVMVENQERNFDDKLLKNVTWLV